MNDRVELLPPPHRKSRCTRKTRIYSYSLDGTFIKEYLSAAEAARELFFFRRSIEKACRDISTTIGGMMWRRVPVGTSKNDIKPYSVKKIKYTPVCVKKYDKEGNFIQEYKSIRSASIDNNIDPKSIRDCLNGKQKQAGGFIYKLK